MEIKRNQYLDKLISYSQTNNIKIITGIRRSGKSVILRQLYDYFSIQNQCLYLNLEDYANFSFHNPQEFNSYLEEQLASGVTHMFIDEVQLVKDFQLVLNSIRLKCNNIYVTGSNAQILSGKLATMLAGRYVSVRVYPFSYQEMLQIKENLTIDEYIFSGGMPTVALLDKEVSQQVLNDLIDTIVINDIIHYNTNIEPELLKRVLLNMLENISTEVSAKNITNYLISNGYKTNINKIYEVLNAMDDAYLITKVSNFDIKGKEVMKNKGKYYLADVGFRRALYPEVRDIGRILENVVFNELEVRGYQIYVGKIGTKEVDFIVKKFDQIFYIQVSSTIEKSIETLNREVAVYKLVHDNYKKILITNDQYKSSLGNGVHHILLKDFLRGESFE